MLFEYLIFHWICGVHTHTHKILFEKHFVFWKRILFQLNDPKSPTPIVPHSEPLTFFVPVFVPHTKAIRLGGNIDPNPPFIFSVLLR